SHNKWLLAGGLNSSNISAAITRFKPTGVDVSSGVENEEGKKDIQLIRNFIAMVKNIGGVESNG
ncbi:N-(5'-phosphoribosyl)anthranilate isomerase, partial [Candidatus Riflebacteria bacterium]